MAGHAVQQRAACRLRAYRDDQYPKLTGDAVTVRSAR